MAAHDEDALTMAVAAALECCEDRSPGPDAIWFASTSPPYLEKQGAALLAAALDAPQEAFTIDVGASLRGWTSSLHLGADALRAGSASRVVVAVGDVRPVAPGSQEELLFGDGGGAALLERDAEGAAVLGWGSVNDTTLVTWRRVGDPYVRSGDLRYAVELGQVGPAVEAARRALAAAGTAAGRVSLLAVAAADPRAAPAVQRALGIKGDLVQAPLDQVGFAGAALPPLLLALALDRASAGDLVLLIATGDGADGVVLEAGQRPRGAGRLEHLLRDTHALPSYHHYLRSRGILANERREPVSSPVVQRREEAQLLRFHGMRCRGCGEIQYPIMPLCGRCGRNELDEVRLSRFGTVYTYTTDHVVAQINPGLPQSPVTMAVIDLEDGARVYLQLTDVRDEELRVGLGVEVCFRLLHEGSDYHNYYWKARPRRG